MSQNPQDVISAHMRDLGRRGATKRWSKTSDPGKPARRPTADLLNDILVELRALNRRLDGDPQAPEQIAA